MKLRTLVKRGTLRAVKNAEGVYEFDMHDLDSLRVTLASASTACGDTMTSHPVVASAAITSAPALAATVNGGSAPPLPAVTAGWMLAATSTPSRDENDDDHADADQVSHEPPFWASSSPFPEGTPVIDPLTRVVTYVSSTGSNAPGSHAPGTTCAVIAQLQQQLADTQAQLAATHAAWRTERCRSVASQEALTAVLASTGGVGADLGQAVLNAAGAATARLDDNQLACDAVAATTARNAGMQAVSRMQAQQVPWPLPQDPNDELSRMRARRRSRSPRW